MFSVPYRENIYEFIKLSAKNNGYNYDKDFIEKSIITTNLIKTKTSSKSTIKNDCIIKNLK